MSTLIETKVTPKFQTTIPKDVRKHLGVKAGKEVEWHIVKEMVVVTAATKMKDPVKFLTSQVKLDYDAVKLVKEAREDFA